VSDSISVVTERGLGSRLGRSIKGVLIGIVLFGLSFPVLFWNEGRAVKRHRDLQEGAGAVVTVQASEVDPANESKLVHMLGIAETDAVLEDSTFGVSANAIHLRRNSEMFQWVEDEDTRTEKQLGGSEKEITTYTYEKEWSEYAHDSSGFHEPSGHQNPPFLYPSEAWTADDVSLGAFQLHPVMIDDVGGFERVTPPTPDEGTGWERAGDMLSWSAAPDSPEPQVGDLRIHFEAAPPADVAVVGVQRGNGFVPWTGSEGSSVIKLSMGPQTAEQMFAALESENRKITWILRGIGFAMMAFGLMLLVGPVAVLGDIVPFVGDLLRFGAALFAGTVAFALSLITIAVGWVAYRPLVGVPLLVLAIAGLLALIWAGRSKRIREPVPEAHTVPA
jgi:hypothetical protein